MDAATARVEPEIHDAIQVARGRVPLEEFRLVPDCMTCMDFAALPATVETNADLRHHIRAEHADLVII